MGLKNYLRGMASVVEIAPLKRRVAKLKFAPKDDAKVLYSDWVVIGRDFSKVIGESGHVNVGKGSTEWVSRREDGLVVSTEGRSTSRTRAAGNRASVRRTAQV